MSQTTRIRHPAMEQRKDSHVSVEEYLRMDAEAPEGVRLEYFDGVVYQNGQPYVPEQAQAMAGAEPEHNQIAGNLQTELNIRLRRRGCRVVTSDQRVHLGTRYVYPDVVVVCTTPAYTEDRPRALKNPGLIVEVESSSTAAEDRGRKLDAYLALDALRAYWIVESEAPRVLQYSRDDDQWTLRILNGLDAVIESPAFEIELPLRDVYAMVFSSDEQI